MFDKTKGIILLDLYGVPRFEYCTNGECMFRVDLCWTTCWDHFSNLNKSIRNLPVNHFRRKFSSRTRTMATNQLIRVFNINAHMFKYKFYCIPSDFLEKIISINNTLTVANSSPLNVKTGHRLWIFHIAKNTVFGSSWPTLRILHSAYQQL